MPEPYIPVPEYFVLAVYHLECKVNGQAFYNKIYNHSLLFYTTVIS